MRIYIIYFLLFSIPICAQATFTNIGFGISAQVPDGWFIEKSDEISNEVKLSNEERNKILKKEGSVFLVYFFANPTSIFDDFNPKIQINAVSKREKTFHDFKMEAIASTLKLKNHLENFKILRQVEDITISGIKSIRFTISYTMDVKGKKRDITCLTYAIPYKNYLFHISMVEGESTNSKDIFEKFIKNVSIRP